MFEYIISIFAGNKGMLYPFLIPKTIDFLSIFDKIDLFDLKKFFMIIKVYTTFIRQLLISADYLLITKTQVDINQFKTKMVRTHNMLIYRQIIFNNIFIAKISEQQNNIY